jgi:hypothetical protein
MPFSFASRALLAALTVSAVVAPAAHAQAPDSSEVLAVTGTRETQIAKDRDAPPANGPSDNTTFSQDNRVVRLMAFDSSASNFVSGDANGKRDVYVFSRAGGFSLLGSVSRVSVGARGVEPNGDSVKPSIDGDTKTAARCVTFESTATNLDRRDRARDSDIFLRDLRRRTTTLVSVGHANARDGVVDGECEFVTYTAGGAVWVRDLQQGSSHKIARGNDPDQQTSGKGVTYARGGQIYYQAFQKVFNHGNPTVKKTARELLVSKGAKGAGNGRSSNPVLDDNGHYVAFESLATNLCVNLCVGVSADANGVGDIFRRTISSKAPTRDRMQMVSYSHGDGDVRAQGNGASNNPAMTGAGENIAFDSEATNLRQSVHIADRNVDPNGSMRDVYYWNFPRGRMSGNVSRESRSGRALDDGGYFNGPSTRPSTSSRANFIGFTSSQSGLSGEQNGADIADTFLRFLGGGPEGE